MDVRLLTLENEEQIKALIESRVTSMGETVPSISHAVTEITTEYDRFKDMFLLESRIKTAFAFGAFEDGELLSIICASMSIATNVWYFLKLITKKHKKSRKAANAVCKHTFDFMEERKFYTFYAFYPIEWAKVYERFMLGVNKDNKKYLVFLDTFIPAKTKTMFSLYHSMLANHLWDMDTGVYLYVLKQEHRKHTATT